MKYSCSTVYASSYDVPYILFIYNMSRLVSTYWPSMCFRDTELLLPRCLDVMLLCEQSSFKQEVTRCVHSLMDAVRRSPQTVTQ